MTVAESISPELISELQRLGAVATANHLLSECTTFRLGGPCPLLVDCTDADSLAACWIALSARGIKPLLIGGGSNLLFSDRGIDQVVIRFVETSPAIHREGDVVTVSAGTSLDDLAKTTTDWGLDGLTVCSGIPGTVGGAIAGNAGAFGQQMGDSLIDVEVIDSTGKLKTVSAVELGFTYRHSRVAERGDILLRARFKLIQASVDDLQARRTEILALRASKHPDWRSIPTAGSFFKNVEPTSKAERRQAAGWYLEQAGALDMRVGGARTFERHANIVIVEPGGTATDVKKLTDQMADSVRVKFGLELQREVKIIGTFP